MTPVKIYSKKYLVISLFFFAAAVSYGLYMYFAPTKSVEKLKVDMSLSAQDLLTQFEADQAAADLTYKGKVLEVKGKVHKTEVQGAIPVLYFDEGGKYVIVAGLQEKYAGKLPSAGEEVKFKGLYSGVIVNDDMFMIPADVKIEQCSITE